MDFHTSPTTDTKIQIPRNHAQHPKFYRDSFQSKLIDDGSSVKTKEMSQAEELRNTNTAVTLPSIVVEDADDYDDDPPPYSAIMPPNHVGWPFDFSSGIPYSMRTTTPCRTEVPLAPFQTSSTLGATFHPEGSDGQHTSISMPLMPRIFKFGSHRSQFLQRNSPFSDGTTVTKDTGGTTRRYGALLIAAAVIVFLMMLSLLVHFVVEKKFWRG